MLFNSLSYAVFLPLVFCLYWLLPHRFRWALILTASCWFYMSWNPGYIVLIFTATLVSYLAGRLLEHLTAPKARKAVVSGALGICLGILFFFKYFNFCSESLAALLGLMAIPMHPVTLKVLLPVGISFYTFQTLSYVLDVYRGKVKPEYHFGIYAAFVSFFPQLVAGPIERTENLLPQIASRKTFSYEQASYGLKLMAWGFFKKLAVADVLAPIVDEVYASLPSATSLDLLVASLFFSLQIYCDFSGYSDIAVGSAKLMGIDLMTNFRSPYFARSIREFWSRWHISLSTWFRDYVYIPMGGSRCSKTKASRNLLVTFLVSGLWHGANWTFVLWGGLHGLAQVIEKQLHLEKPRPGAFRSAVRCCLVFSFCCITWVFFRAERISDAFGILRQLFFGGSWYLHTVSAAGYTWLQAGIAIAVLGVYDYCSTRQDVIAWVSRQNCVLRWTIYLILIWMILCFMPVIGNSEFVYFQF